MKLDAEDIDAVARRVVEMIRQQPADSDPWLTREQAAKYLNFSQSSFERARREHAEALKPCSEHPVRWSRNALDVFKMTRGAPLRLRPGRKPGQRIAA